MAVKIVTDSTSYIPNDLIKQLDITITSLNVILNGTSYKEVELENKDFYERMELSSEIPTSSQPGMDELLKIFKKIVNNGDEVLAIFISSKMSGTYSSAHLVKNIVLEEYKDGMIEILDSNTNCMQMGFIVLESAKAAKAGKTIDEVIKIAEDVKKNSKFLFVPETLKYLQKGGRIGKASALLGGIFQIKPILTVENGETTVFEKVRTKKRAVDAILNKVIEDCKNKEIGGIIVHHINCEEEGKEIAKKLEQKFNIPIKIQSIGPVIGVHVGPGSVGVAYFHKYKI